MPYKANAKPPPNAMNTCLHTVCLPPMPVHDNTCHTPGMVIDYKD